MMLLTIRFHNFVCTEKDGGGKVFPTLTVSAVGPVVRESSSDRLTMRAKTKADKKRPHSTGSKQKQAAWC